MTIYNRNILIIIALVAFFFAAPQQTNAQFAVGFKAGGGVGQLNVSPVIAQDFALGYTSAVFVRYLPPAARDSKTGLTAGVQAEFSYSQKGWKPTEAAYQSSVEYIAFSPVTYISVGRRAFKAHFDIGPHLGWQQQAYYGTRWGMGTTPENEKSFTDSVAGFEFAFTGGLGFVFDTKIGAFGLDARYVHAFTNIIDLPKRKPDDIIRIGTEDSDMVLWQQSQYAYVALVYSVNFGKKRRSK